MRHRQRWFVWSVLGVAAGAVALALLLVGVQTRRHEAARARWAAQAPPHYLLDLTLSGDELSGRLRAEVRAGALLSATDRATGLALGAADLRALGRILPVEQLFERVAEAYRPSGRWDRDLARRSPALRALFARLGVLRSPGCWLPSLDHVVYDPDRGYPRRLGWSSNQCDDGMFSLDQFDLEITDLRPLQD